jgi:hypothetical protein
MAWEKFRSLAPPAQLGDVGDWIGRAAGQHLLRLPAGSGSATFAGSLSRAAFLSARNDAFANIAIILAAGITALWPSGWPDLVVGVGIFLMNLDAAHEVYVAARRENRGVA